MQKLTETQLDTLKSLPYWDRIKDLINLYEVGILSQNSFNEELLKARSNYIPEQKNDSLNSTQLKNTLVDIEMALVEGGTFLMGSEERFSPHERPIHQVTISDFYIGIKEVTQEQYKALMGINPSDQISDSSPVVQVTWYDAVEFCNKLSDNNGLQKCYTGYGNSILCNFKANGYRLPTEAEWVYSYKSSNKIKNSGYNCSGNTSEWCWDWYGLYTSTPKINPQGPSIGTTRVLRRGFYRCGSRCQHEMRIDWKPDESLPDECSFRIARSKP